MEKQQIANIDSMLSFDGFAICVVPSLRCVHMRHRSLVTNERILHSITPAASNFPQHFRSSFVRCQCRAKMPHGLVIASKLDGTLLRAISIATIAVHMQKTTKNKYIWVQFTSSAQLCQWIWVRAFCLYSGNTCACSVPMPWNHYMTGMREKESKTRIAVLVFAQRRTRQRNGKKLKFAFALCAVLYRVALFVTLMC